jgi:AcrR family transcriptional regulator
MSSGAPLPVRRRNAAATRQAILDAAVAAFTRCGYAGVGVREIAQAAGVTAMLVNRYFGSKEQLFAEAVDTAFAPRTVVGEEPVSLAHDTAATLVARTAPGAEQIGPFLLMLRSVADPRAAEIIRAASERHVGRHLAERLEGPDAAARAELVLSVIAGVWLMRTVMGTTAITAAEETELARRLERVFSVLMAPSTSS